MADSHLKTFFGQNTGIIVSSFSSSDPFTFIHCFKKKPNGIWEKPSSREGKSIKFSLEEIVLILRVLNRQTLTWQSQHNYKDNTTSISFNWEDDEADVLWINVGKYSKRLNLAQTEILRLLLSHFLQEKIIHSTLPKKLARSIKTKNPLQPEKTKKIGGDFDEDYNASLCKSFNREIMSNEMTDIEGTIVGETDKAFLIKFDKIEEWIPKSAINNRSIPQKNNSQKFKIDNWILLKLSLIP
ncbi:MAG: hypothetical protein HWN80_15940 [Candidatus Lokiarchaeota archaeon]|nr:hypothetical protein [Candidatus Lokiarchaeota archaeon]